MCLTRIYVRRKRDGRLMRFNSVAALRNYRKNEHENRRTLPTITREEFISIKNRRYEQPTWIKSVIYDGMALLADER